MEGEGSLEFQEWEVHSDAEAVVVRSPVLEENRRSFEEIEVDSAGLSGSAQYHHASHTAESLLTPTQLFHSFYLGAAGARGITLDPSKVATSVDI
ncbi:unnamed protein product [Linum tenue]|uniref:Uncharacterized protein n=1 Tax=Linum tenue TaxID=586396 RepID=A0AAV0R1H7_9ROSI|nr:unnamed protein product [Linum tenue]